MSQPSIRTVMPTLVHIAPETMLGRIRRSGLAPRRVPGFIEGEDRLVWAFPVLASYTLTHSWMRELKRFGQHTLVAVHFRIADDEPVYARHYRDTPQPYSAAEAVGHIRALPDPRGAEIIVPRRIAASEITAIRPLPRGIGWRYFPEAKTRPLNLCDCPMCSPRGEVKARRYRERVAEARRSSEGSD